MNVLPVIVRELRAQSRQRFTYWLRTIGATALLGVVFMFIWSPGTSANDGARLFTWLHFTLFCAIWILVPISTADCISRERREGTLGLLFLTPLRPWNIVVAKILVHASRAASLLVAVLPVLTIPFLIGGVTWELACISTMLHLNSICWALAATLLASAISKSAWRALVGAFLMTASALCAVIFLMGQMGLKFLVQTGQMPTEMMSNREMLEIGYYLLSMQENFWSEFLTVGGIGSFQCIMETVKVSGGSLGVLALSILFAAWRMSRNWREERPPLWIRKTQQVFLTPVIWKKFLSRWLRWQLDRNPLGWLERRHWLSRLISWTWFAISATVSTIALTDDFFFTQSELLLVIGWAMMASMSVSVAGSFRRERETGAMELLLVTPLTVRQIILGRIRGLWGQFLPAVGLFLGVWAYLGSMLDSEVLPAIIYFVGIFLTLPLIGLYFSIRCRSYFVAFLLTLAVGMFAPLIFGAIGYVIVQDFELHLNDAWPWVGSILLFKCLFAAWLGWLLHRRLERRIFPLDRITG